MGLREVSAKSPSLLLQALCVNEEHNSERELSPGVWFVSSPTSSTGCIARFPLWFVVGGIASAERASNPSVSTCAVICAGGKCSSVVCVRLCVRVIFLLVLSGSSSSPVLLRPPG